MSSLEEKINILNDLIKLKPQKTGEIYTATDCVESNLNETLKRCEGICDDWEKSDDVLFDFGRLIVKLLLDITVKRNELEDEEVLSLQQWNVIKESLFMLSATIVSPCTDFKMGMEMNNFLMKLWPKTTDLKTRIEKLQFFISPVFSLMDSNVSIKSQILNLIVPQLLIALEQLTILDPESEFTVSNNQKLSKVIPTKLLSEVLFGLMKTTKDKWIQIALNNRMKWVLREEGGTQMMLETIDQMGGDRLWLQTMFCSSLAKAFVTTGINSKRFFIDFKNTLILFNDIHHFGYLPALVIERALKGKTWSVTVDTHWMDTVSQPFDVLWEYTPEDEKWKDSAEKAFFLTLTWLVFANKLTPLKITSRITKLTASLIVIHGRLVMEDKEETRNLREVLVTAIDTVINWSDCKATFLLELFNLIQLPYCLPQITFKSVSTAKYGSLSLSSEDDEELRCDIYLASIKSVINGMSGSKALLIVSFLSKIMESWLDEEASEKEQINFVRNFATSSTFRTASVKKDVVMSYLLVSVGEWFVSSEAVENSECAVEMVKMSTNLLRRFNNLMVSQLQKQSQYDLTPNNDEYLHKIRTVQMALAFLGAQYFQSKDEQTELLFNEAMDLLIDLKNNIKLLKSNSKEFSLLVDDINDFLKCLGKEDNSTITKRSTKPNSEVDDWLQVLERDFEDEQGGSLEIAERGHAIISLGKMIRKKDDIIKEVGLAKVFDLLTTNLRHFDSYVFLSAINAISHIVLWEHSTFVSKIFFLFQTWECRCNINYDSDEEPHPSTSNPKQDSECLPCLKARVQLGECISRVMLELGEYSLAYYNELQLTMTELICHSNPLISASALSGLSNLVQASGGKAIWKNFFQVLYSCQSRLTPNVDQLVRRASVLLLRTMLSTQTFNAIQSNKEASSSLIKCLKQVKNNDLDEVVRLHASLALIDLKELLQQTFLENGLESFTRVL